MFYLPEPQTAHFDEAPLNSGDASSHFLYNIVLWAPGHPAEFAGAGEKGAGRTSIPTWWCRGWIRNQEVLAGVSSSRA